MKILKKNYSLDDYRLKVLREDNTQIEALVKKLLVEVGDNSKLQALINEVAEVVEIDKKLIELLLKNR